MQAQPEAFHGRVVVITGAGGGLGEALSRHLVRQGAAVILSSRQPEKLQQAAAAAAAVGGPGRVLGTAVADLASDEGCAQLHAACEQIAPQIDMLINNAGMGAYGPLHAVPQATWERLVQINLLAPLRLTARFLPAMVARRAGHIVLISSIFGLRGLPGVSAYTTTKFGLRGLGKSLAEDVRGLGVDVSVVYPSFTRTAMLDAAPQYGGARVAVPDWLVDATDPVIARTLAGLARRRLHIYPSLRAHAYALASRVAPWAIPPLARLVTG